MRKIATILVIAIFFCAGLQLAAQTGKPAWKGTVATKDGVKVVKNPSEPLYGEFVFDLKEDLRLGGDPEKEASYFPKGAMLSVDAAGNLYVTDRGNRRVQMFDKNGAFIRTIGRQGQGPGEYMFPGGVYFDADGNIWIDGGRQMVVFSKDGLFVRNVSIAKSLMRKMVGPGGSFIGTTQPSLAQGDPKLELIKVEPDGKTLRTIAEFRNELSQAKEAIAFHYYSTWISFVPVSADSFAYGFSGEYRIWYADAEGRTLFVMTKAEKPQAISAGEKDETRKNGLYAWMGGNSRDEGVFFPDHRPYFEPYFAQFMADDAGRLYVPRPNSILEKDAPTRVDVFSREGVYLYRMTWASRPTTIRAGFLYEVREDPETSEYLVIRQKITNWEAMKSR
ncbi:MAG TPA: 6-bladed beta-propeller [Candidatus Latescibacteria bacterium]|nr:6-bladed beta-propeller [Candidatus Latescibacterota bacterium]